MVRRNLRKILYVFELVALAGYPVLAILGTAAMGAVVGFVIFIGNLAKIMFSPEDILINHLNFIIFSGTLLVSSLVGIGCILGLAFLSVVYLAVDIERFRAYKPAVLACAMGSAVPFAWLGMSWWMTADSRFGPHLYRDLFLMGLIVLVPVCHLWLDIAFHAGRDEVIEDDGQAGGAVRISSPDS